VSHELFPLAPLMPYLLADVASHATTANFLHAGPSTVLPRMGIHARSYFRWCQVGLSAMHADRAAVYFNLHPLNIWPDYYDHFVLHMETRRLASNQPDRDRRARARTTVAT